jgi:hypothetical protein
MMCSAVATLLPPNFCTTKGTMPFSFSEREGKMGGEGMAQ